MIAANALSQWGLTGLEIASGVVLGVAPMVSRPPVEPIRLGPLEALEAAVLPALLRTPCVISFSGGMDSSFVLAVAVRVARREGLPDPVPITWRFTDAPRAAESQWQDDVCRSLGITERLIWHAGDDLDLIGPVAARLLRQHGVVHPANLHLHLPIVDAAAGGSILTGFGGDQILAGFGRPTKAWRRQVVRVPPRLRVQVRRLRGRDPLRWLHSEFSNVVQRRMLAERRSQPVSLADRIAWQLRRRDLISSREHFGAMATNGDVLAIHPFLDPGFHAALAGFDPPAGLAGRAAVLNTIGEGILPAQAWASRPKARFTEVFVRQTTRDFVRQWTGDGADRTYVDEGALQKQWHADDPEVGSAALVQQVWLNLSTRMQVPSNTR